MVELGLIRFILKAGSPSGLTRLMLKLNLKDKTLYQYSEMKEAKDGSWYCCYLKDGLKSNGRIK